MAGGQWVPKSALIDEIRRTMIDGESGAFTILTDQKRSIMFRFSEGKLIHSHCRSRDVNEAITALRDCNELKFSHSSIKPKDQDEIIAAEAFLQAVSPNEFVQAPAADIITEPKTRPLVEKLDTATPAAASSGAFNQRVAELEDEPAEESVQTEETKEEIKPSEPEHRLFF